MTQNNGTTKNKYYKFWMIGTHTVNISIRGHGKNNI